MHIEYVVMTEDFFSFCECKTNLVLMQNFIAALGPTESRAKAGSEYDMRRSPCIMFIKHFKAQ